MNSGERDELAFKLALVYMRDNKVPLFGQALTKVGFGRSEYKSLPNGVNLDKIKNATEAQLVNWCEAIGAGKSPTGAKADIFINGIGVSLKSLKAAPPALVNHTSRPGFDFACRNSGTTINELDTIIDEYWRLRKAGTISEDTKNTDSSCPFKNHKEYMRPILEYFLFKGTGSKLSDFPAEYIIEFSEPCSTSTYKKLTKTDAVDSVWPKLIFSLRAKKGMPSDYNKNTYRGPNAESIARWVEYINDDYRGALHIRSSR